MCTIACETDYDRRYIGFYIIEEDLEYANRTDSFTTDLTLDDYKEYIKNEFQIFLEMFEVSIPILKKINAIVQIVKVLLELKG